MSLDPSLPALRDAQIRIAELGSYARLFDDISGRERYVAAEFVTWVSAELRPEDHQRRRQSLPAGRPGQCRAAEAA